MIAQVKEVTVAHSPDSDDAFMFYALAKDILDTGGLKVNQVLKDIQSLNKDAMTGLYEVSAISFAAYPFVSDKYSLMPCGASMGSNYGPIVVSKKPMNPAQLSSARIAIPGKLTTAYLALRLFANDSLRVEEVHFDQIPDEVEKGNYDCGLLIHEGQLTYGQKGLHKVVDLGEWWHELTGGLPLPLGGNVIRKDLGPDLVRHLTTLLHDSIKYSLDHRKEALEYAMTFARDMEPSLADKFVGMYVNDLTLDYGSAGRKSVERLFQMANERGIYDQAIVPEFVTLAV